jgi:hypothetical protein
MNEILTPTVRRYIYGIIATLVPLLVTTGVLTGDIAGHILAISASVLSIGGSALALANVSDE